ncbi:autotransporter domain-containing protein [Phyllobacterium chamaecytisi]|uniref:autotransporter domain-containing protein n=1 Tax=Phyllobacterium chamaecytisi TaxID=2876082 RepID=UPI001CCD28AB|nr:autotransporter domain-containing protein [Phyllobacterium sp. KW56]MBZ9600363.1 autotransporter domain-containing protein [Phyllobacterium sp. KW56]
MYAFSGADSARSPLSPSFHRVRRKLLSFVSAAAIAIALPAVPALAQEVGKYFMADGTKTDELAKAAASWRTPEFLKDHALAGVKAEYAYAFGFTGKSVKLGMVDSGIYSAHPQLQGKFTSLTVEGFYSADGEQLDGRNKTWKKGDPFKVFGDYDPFFNDSHGTSAAGEMIAIRNATGDAEKDRMHGIAFDAHLYSANTGGTDNTVFGPNVDYGYFKEAYGILARNGARVINSSWGQEARDAGDYGTLDGLTKLYSRFVGKKTFLDAAFEVSKEYGTIQVWANGNEGRNNPRAVVAMPYFRPEVEPYWIGVTGVTKDGDTIFDRCGVTKYWCMAGPTQGISTTSVGVNGGEDERDGGGHTPDDLAKKPLTPAYRSGYSGTSAAAPNVTASLGLVMDRFAYMTGTQARDVLFTTAEHLGDGSADLPDTTFGWGRPDLKKAMNGPGQFLSRFNANLGEGVTDTWVSDISQVALDQRKKEEQQEITAWSARKTALGLNDGIPANLVETLAETLVSEVPKGKELLKAAIAASIEGNFIIEENYTAEKFQAALAAAEANPAGSALLALYEKSHPGWTSNWSETTDYTNFIASYTDDLVLAGVIAAVKAEGIETEYSSTETRTAYLATKAYDAGLTKSGLGTLTLSGKNTYRGDTIVDGGKLAIAEGGSIISNTFVNYTGQFSVDGTAANATINQGGELRVNQTGITGDLTFNGGWGVIYGKSGNASVNGGSLIIGNAGISGDLVLNGGFAAVYGMAGDATVNAGGELGGKGGSVASLVVNRDGLVSPAGQFHTQEQDDGLVKSWPPHGTEIGVLTVTGDATFHPGSLLNIGIMWDASGADLLKVDGTANLLGGIVAVRLENQVALLSQKTIEGLFLDKSYEVLNAGKGVTGRFDSVLPQYNYVTAELDYSDANKITLGFGLTDAGQDEEDRLAREEKLRLLKERVKSLVLVDAKTPNQIAVGGAIKELELGNPLLNTVLFSAIGEILPYDNLSGEAHATLAGVLAKDASVIGNAAQNRIRAAFDGVAVKEQAVIASPLAYAPAQRAKISDAFASVTPAPATTALWGEAYGGWAYAGGDGNAAGYSRNTGGFVTGLDGAVADDWRIGVLAGYGNTSLDSRASNASVDSYSIGLYGGTAWDNLRLSLGTALTQNEIDTDRTAVFGDLAGGHSASYDAKTVQVFGELGYAVKTAYADFEPFAAASYVHLKSDGFQESGEISNLTGLAGTTDLTTTTLGLRLSRSFAISQTISLDAHGMLGWSHAFGDVTPEQRLAFAGGQPFDVKGLPVATDTGIVEAGFDVGIGKATTLGLTYSGQFSDSASDNAVKADLTVKF